MEKKNPNKFKGLLVYLGIPIIVILVVGFFYSMSAGEKPTYSEIVGYFEDQKVTEFSVNGNSANMTLKLEDGTEIKHKLMDWETFKEDVWDDIEKYDDTHKEPMKIDLVASNNNAIWVELVPTILLTVAFVAFFIFLMRRMGNGGMGSKELNFGKAKFKNSADEKKKTTFEDVAGADEEKEELEEIVEFLKAK